MASIFLSYDHEDASLAGPIAAALEKAGHSVWFDRHIHGGAQYSRKIEQALDAADAVVVLWSPRSLDSAWVRDEAADGRDRGKLVPLSIGGVTPPMGFRQFQTIDLGAWSGRGRVPHLAEMLDAVASQAEERGAPPIPSSHGVAALPASAPISRKWLAAGLAALLVAALGFGLWARLGRDRLPVVEVAAANGSSRSQAIASDLFVKLGSLAQVGEGKWKLVDAESAPAKPNFVFRTADTSTAGKPQANLVLLDGKDDSLLWSREFSFPAGGEADLRQQLSFTAGRVLGCALETREAGGLRRDLFKLFLTTCALIAETSSNYPEKITAPLRTIVSANPRFTPAWGRLITAGTNVMDLARFGGVEAVARAAQELRTDMEKARRVAPGLPELVYAEVMFMPPNAYERRLQLLSKALKQAPGNTQLLTDQSMTFQSVGRMGDAIGSARRMAELDPLSPVATTHLIMTLAYGGQLDEARKELARAERLWAGTGALRDAQWGFHLRFGDPATARQKAGFKDEGLDVYLDARSDPSPANIKRLVADLNHFKSKSGQVGMTSWAVQALAEFNQVDELLDWIARTPTDMMAWDSYVFFRPAFKNFRRDPRFMAFAKRLGLTRYWRTSGQWPDFCNEPALPYDCKAEAAKLAS